jgi:ribosome-binding factor A
MSRSAPRSSRTPSQRQLRVGELVRHALSEIIARGEVHDAEIESSLVTISEVAMSPDLKLATCFVRAFGQSDTTPSVEALDRHRRYLRGAVARRIELRFSPDLRFRADTSFDTGDRIDALLRSPSVRRDIDRDPSDS